MTDVSKNPPPMPRRMSAPKAEDTKPSKIIAIFWWVVFIVPVVFLTSQPNRSFSHWLLLQLGS